MTDLAKNHYGHLLSVTFVTEKSKMEHKPGRPDE